MTSSKQPRYVLFEMNDEGQLAPVVERTKEDAPAETEPVTVPTGRPPLCETERRSYKVLLSLTEREYAVIERKAGIAQRATYVHKFLKDHGLFD